MPVHGGVLVDDLYTFARFTSWALLGTRTPAPFDPGDDGDQDSESAS